MITQINVSSPANEILFTDTAIGNAVDSIKASSARVFWITVDNSANAAASYLKLWNATSGSITVGTTAPDFIAYVPGLSIVTLNFGTSAAPGLVFGTALSATCLTAAGTAGTVSPSSAVTCTISYV
jgi:hypothetical protein